ncbi:MAG: hypothetical protein ACFFFB_17630 [Candidatus Heimdallarchaeota archaeon]
MEVHQASNNHKLRLNPFRYPSNNWYLELQTRSCYFPICIYQRLLYLLEMFGIPS